MSEISKQERIKGAFYGAIVGDALCLFAGLSKTSLIKFLLLVGVGKLVRYGFIAFLVMSSMA